MSSWEVIVILAGVVAAAIAAGSFFAFSNFVMPALSKLPASDGARAMQEINRAAPSVGFVAALVGGVVAGLPVLVADLDALTRTENQLVAAAVATSGLSLVTTISRNIPKNNGLDEADPASPAGERYWQRYVPAWTSDNTVRCLASIASAVMYALSLHSW